MNLENRPVPDNGGNWGILGGTFDPVHFGHINLALEIKNKKQLDGVIFIPSINHPCKEPACYESYEDRVRMLEISLKDYSEFIISKIESEQELSGYTFDTITALKQKYTKANYYFIVGSDNVSQLSTWYNAEQLLESVKFLVGTRPGFKFELPNGFSGDNIEFIETSVVKSSSTYIRKLIKGEADSEIIDKFIPLEVRNYIKERKLYQ